MERETPCDGRKQREPSHAGTGALEYCCTRRESVGGQMEERNTDSSWRTSQVWFSSVWFISSIHGHISIILQSGLQHWCHFKLHEIQSSNRACVVVNDRLFVIGGQEGDFMAKPGSPIFKCSRRHEVSFYLHHLRLPNSVSCLAICLSLINTAFTFFSGSLQWCFHARRWNEMESYPSNAKAKLSYWVCLGDCQQLDYHHRRHDRETPSDQEDDLGWGDLSISSRFIGISLVHSYINGLLF